MLVSGVMKRQTTAMSALDLHRVPYSDFKHKIHHYILSPWQDDWNGAVANKLLSVKPVLGDWQTSYRRCRKDEIVLCRARIGNTHLMPSCVLKQDHSPVSVFSYVKFLYMKFM